MRGREQQELVKSLVMERQEILEALEDLAEARKERLSLCVSEPDFLTRSVGLAIRELGTRGWSICVHPDGCIDATFLDHTFPLFTAIVVEQQRLHVERMRRSEELEW
jgi:hypothetical protein